LQFEKLFVTLYVNRLRDEIKDVSKVDIFFCLTTGYLKNIFTFASLLLYIMSKDSILNNLFRAAANMLTQFSTEEPLISEETKAILNDSEGKVELYDKIMSKRKHGEVTLNLKGQDIKFFVEA
jgi:hypothetical protein